MPGPGYSFLGAEERENVWKALEEWQLTRYHPERRSFVLQFEQEVQRVFDTPRCLAVNSCTSGLLTALAGLGIGPGDEVIVPGYTFIASIASIVYSGATPVLAEIDESLTLDPGDVAARIGPNTRAIMAVHMLGAPCDMSALSGLAKEHGIALIEDVAQACGASYHGRRLGTIGDAGAYSLNPFKVITAGDGGFVVFRDAAAYERAFAFHDHGWAPLRDESRTSGALFGLNVRMGDLTGAVALAQFAKLDTILDETRRIKRELLARVSVGGCFHRRALHDRAGECGTLLVYLFDEAAVAQEVAQRLGSKTLLESGRHYYGNMPQMRSPRLAHAFRRDGWDGQRAYEPGMLPRTDDVLARAIALSVGVSDAYLGAGFGATVRSSIEEIERVAGRFNQTIELVDC